MMTENDKQFKEKMKVLRAITKLCPESRLEIISYFCRGCGDKQPWHPDNPDPGDNACGCTCMRDE